MRGVGLLVLVGTLAGCGTGGEAALTKEAFLEQGNAICREGNAAIEAAVPVEMMEGGEPSEEVMLAFFDTIIDGTRQQLDNLDALAPPAELEADFDELIADARDTLEQVEADGPDALFGSEDDPFAYLDERALALGLAGCAESGE
jgi:hypothetical protein